MGAQWIIQSQSGPGLFEAWPPNGPLTGPGLAVYGDMEYPILMIQSVLPKERRQKIMGLLETVGMMKQSSFHGGISCTKRLPGNHASGKGHDPGKADLNFLGGRRGP
jgi:hypothetical protein